MSDFEPLKDSRPQGADCFNSYLPVDADFRNKGHSLIDERASTPDFGG